jgi:hypothetical protein
MSLDDKYETRCNSFDKADYIRRCQSLGVEHTDMTREIMQAFNTGRLRIVPTEDQSVMIKGIHHEP